MIIRETGTDCRPRQLFGAAFCPSQASVFDLRFVELNLAATLTAVLRAVLRVDIDDALERTPQLGFAALRAPRLDQVTLSANGDLAVLEGSLPWDAQYGVLPPEAGAPFVWRLRLMPASGTSA